MSNKRRPGNDDGREDEGRKGCQVHGNVAEPEHAKVCYPAHSQDSHPPEHRHDHLAYERLACYMSMWTSDLPYVPD